MGLLSARLITAFWAVLMALCFTVPAAAAEPVHPSCQAFSTLGTSHAQMAADPARWNCGTLKWQDDRPEAWLRFDAAAWGDNPPQVLITRATKFDWLEIFAVDSDGAVRSIRHDPNDVTLRAGGATFSATLPPISERTTAIVVRVDKPWDSAILSQARLSADPQRGAWPLWLMVGLGMVAGLLLAPLIFDLSLFYVLRQRFVLWHAGVAFGMFGHLVCFSGMIVLFAPVGVAMLAKLSGITAVLAVAAAGVFTAEFIEPDKLSGPIRKSLWLSSAFAVAVPGVITLHPPFLEYTSHKFFYLGFLVPLLAQLAAITQAWRRNSRAVKFQIAAWTPVLLCLVERMARGLGLYTAPPFADELLYFALAVEVVISMLGVADRILVLRDERDHALTESRAHETLAERDPLTGLMNRRAIEPRFRQLCSEGFNTFALLDLDYFKSVNDRHGHAVGDEVLRATAKALAPDKDTLVMRLGGEEFLLLLRGPDARSRAEHRRAMLPRHIAETLPDLDDVVTASMGVVEGSADTMNVSLFNDVYARADKLLYEAKQAGRNRTIGEKLTVFAPPSQERRKADRRRAAERKIA